MIFMMKKIITYCMKTNIVVSCLCIMIILGVYGCNQECVNDQDCPEQSICKGNKCLCDLMFVPSICLVTVDKNGKIIAPEKIIYLVDNIMNIEKFRESWRISPFCLAMTSTGSYELEVLWRKEKKFYKVEVYPLEKACHPITQYIFIQFSQPDST